MLERLENDGEHQQSVYSHSRALTGAKTTNKTRMRVIAASLSAEVKGSKTRC